MTCRKQLDGLCSESDQCAHVQLSQDYQGCGINGQRVLDLIMGTPASQTEVVARLVEV